MPAGHTAESETGPVDIRSARNTALAMGTLALLLGFALGLDNPLVAMMVALTTANLGLAVIPLALRIPDRWYHVPRAERVLHYLLGVPVFGWLLDVSGWNRHIALPLRQLRVNRASLSELLVNIHAAEGAHAIAFLPHLALAALAYAGGHTGGALWYLGPGIVMHLYPVLLQRWMTLRVAPLVRTRR